MRSNFVNLLIAISLLIICAIQLAGDRYRIQWFAMAVAVTTIAMVGVWKTFRPSLAIFLSYLLISILVPVLKDPVVFWVSDIPYTNGVVSAMGWSGLFIVLSLIATTVLPITIEAISMSAMAASVLGIAWTFCQYRAPEFELGGFLKQGSMHGCFLAVLFPAAFGYFKGRRKYFYFIAAVLAVLFLTKRNHASNAIGAFGVAVASLGGLKFMRRDIDGVSVAATIISLLVLGGIAGCALNPEILNDSGRFFMYRFFLADWWKNGSVLFGNGPGSFVVTGPTLQIKANLLHGPWGDIFLWLHSDWLQSLIEFGAIGLVLGLWVAIDILRSFYRREEFGPLASALTFMSVMVFQYPWRLAPFAFFGSLLGAYALKKEAPCQS